MAIIIGPKLAPLLLGVVVDHRVDEERWSVRSLALQEPRQLVGLMALPGKSGAGGGSVSMLVRRRVALARRSVPASACAADESTLYVFAVVQMPTVRT